jgi:hypothetical protein
LEAHIIAVNYMDKVSNFHVLCLQVASLNMYLLCNRVAARAKRFGAHPAITLWPIGHATPIV